MTSYFGYLLTMSDTRCTKISNLLDLFILQKVSQHRTMLLGHKCMSYEGNIISLNPQHNGYHFLKSLLQVINQHNNRIMLEI